VPPPAAETTPSPYYDLLDETAILSESLEFAETHSGTCEDVMEWPIFGGRYHRSETERLIFNPDLASLQVNQYHTPDGSSGRLKSTVSSSVHKSAPGRGIQESDALALVERFLIYVHIKNPILDSLQIRRMAKDIMENGFRWDGTSCIVVRYTIPARLDSSLC
jgi:hypothetical protein